MVDWQAILKEYGPMVWQTVFRLLNHHADACDCYQETFIAAHEFVEKQAVVNWGALLARLATRRAIDRLRSRVRNELRFAPVEDELNVVDRTNSPFDLACGVERLDQVRSILAELPEKQAEVFWLSCLEGFSNAEIGQQMEISDGEVRVLLHRAKARLRVVLEPWLLEERDET